MIKTNKIKVVASLVLLVIGTVAAISVYQSIPEEKTIQEEISIPLLEKAQICHSWGEVDLFWSGQPIQDWVSRNRLTRATAEDDWRYEPLNSMNYVDSLDKLVKNSDNFEKIFILLDDTQEIVYIAHNNSDGENVYSFLKIPQVPQHYYYKGVTEVQVTNNTLLLTYQLDTINLFFFPRKYFLMALIAGFLIIVGIVGFIINYFEIDWASWFTSPRCG